MSGQGTAVFVSYSHADASLVAPVVKLLRVNKSLVFQDIDRIQPGKKWRNEITNALAEAQLVVVFWCDHASRSNEVSKEWKAAIEYEKDLLPLLLDATPLPPELSEFQWIDFRGTVGANHTSIDSPAPVTSAPAKPGHWLLFAGLAIIFISFAGGVLLTTGYDPQNTAQPPIDPPPIAGGAPGSSILLLVSVIIAVTASIAWILRRRSKRVKIFKRAGSRCGEIERRIATELEAEILRRTTTKRDA